MASEIRVNQIQNRSGLTTVTWNDEGLNVVGVVTATSFSGNLTGAASQLVTNATGANLTLSGNLGVAGTVTYEDVARVDATGISTFREGFNLGPLAGIALTAYKDGSIRTSGVITATTYYGSGAQLTGITGTTINNNANNRVITGSASAGTLEAEATLLWDGTDKLSVYDGSGYPSLKFECATSGGSYEWARFIGGGNGLRIANTNFSANASGDELILGTSNNSRGITIASGNASGNSGNIFFADSGSNTAGRISYEQDTDALVLYTATSERLRIDSNGNMGLGESSISPVGGTYKAFDIAYKGTGLSGRTDNPTFNLRSNIYYNGSAWKYGEGNTTAGVLNIGGGQMHFYHAASGSAGATATLNEVFNINDSGMMLWGTSNTGNLTAGGVKVQTAAVNGEAIALNLRNPDITAAGNASVSIDFNMDRSPSGGIHFRAGTIRCKKEQNWTTSASTVDASMGFYLAENESHVEKVLIGSDGKISFNGDNDTYVYRNTTNTLQVHTNGTLCTEFSANQRVRMPQVYSTNGSSMRDVQVESDGTLCAGNTSIRASKINIKPQTDVSWLYDLVPSTFNYRKKIVDKENGNHTYLDEAQTETSYGLIAEEVETVQQDFCFYNDGELAGVSYSQLITPLLKAIQDQKKEIDTLKTEVAALKSS